MLGFLYDLGCTLSLFVLVVFMEGVIATRKNAKWTGLILPVVLLIISVFVGAYMHDLGRVPVFAHSCGLVSGDLFLFQTSGEKRHGCAYHQGTDGRLSGKKKERKGSFFCGETYCDGAKNMIYWL